MIKKERFKDCHNYPADAICLSFINLAISLISFKILLSFFRFESFESWALLILTALGVSASVSIFRFKAWSLEFFHYFSLLVGLAALGQLYFRPNPTNYYTLLAVVTYSALGSLILHRYVHSACFAKTGSSCSSRLPIKLGAKLNFKTNNLPVEITNISRTGCFLETNQKLELGKTVHLAIELDDYCLRTACKVMRESSEPQGYGVMFTGIDHRKFANYDVAIKGLLHKVNDLHTRTSLGA